ncbi:MAG TPA: MgtC/SapB family protein [Chloroflexota bacterium]|nr:MgtC/SapB family protein [Chloroflexota bacterium]
MISSELLWSDVSILTRLLASLLLGGAIGWERESTGKAAGVRTHMLVALAAALFVALGDQFLLTFGERGEIIQSDPLRIIEAVVTGISFLGAGMIFVSRGRDTVKGLTTAATTLTTAAIGITVGMERYVLAVGATALVLLILNLLPRVYRGTEDD